MSDQPQTPKTPWLSDKAYNNLKWIAVILLPASGALYFGLSQIWGLPKGAEVVGTIALVTTFLGALLAISTKQYNTLPDSSKFDGVIDVVKTDDGSMGYNLRLTEDDLATLHEKQQVTFQVLNPVR